MVGERIKFEREKRKLSQRNLSIRSNINNSTLSRIESGEREPDADTIKSVAKALNVTTDYLYGLTDIPNFSKLEDNLNKIKESGQYEVNKELTDNELDANLEELLSRAKVKFQGRELTKAEIKAILNTAKSILDLRDDEQGDK
jgi:transcriptional regulator with XRE-family HTH domain